MLFRASLRPLGRRFATVLLSAVILSGLWTAPLPAADALKDNSSLKFVPADVAFYGTTLRNKELYDAIVNSRAVARIQAMPYVQIAWAAVQGQLSNPEGPLAQASAWLEIEENKELLSLLGDMVSHEIFSCGDEAWADWAGVLREMQASNQFSKLQKQLQPGEEDSENSTLADLFTILNEYREDLEVPNLVIGFKLTDKQRATNQLQRLQSLVEAVLASNDDWNDRFERAKIAGGDFLKLELDGSLIPWEAIPFGDIESEEGEFDALVKTLKEMELTICLGVRGDYLLLSLGDGAKYLEKLKGGKLLYDRPELAALRKHTDKPITNVGYISQEYAQLTDQSGEVVSQFTALLENVIPALDIEDELKNEMLEDLGKLAADEEETESTAGAQVSFTYRNDTGYESYAYDWSKDERSDASQKLTLASYLGGNPLLFAVSRTKSNPEDYKTVVKVLERLFHYGEQYGLSKADDNQRELYQKYRDAFTPLLEKLNRVTSEMLLPSLKDGQTGLVLDAQQTSKQWFQGMPPSTKPLPMPELGLIFGVSDEKLLKKAFGEYFAIAQEIADKLHELEPSQVPEVKIPAPDAKTAGGATIYSYPLPSELGLDDQLTPSAGVSKQVAVLSTSRPLAQRTLKSTPLAVKTGPLSAIDKPLSAACYFNWAGVVDSAMPWIEYAVRVNAATNKSTDSEDDDQDEKKDKAKAAEAEEDDPSVTFVVEMIRNGLDILKCFRSYSSVTYVEGKARVTHSASVWQDVAE